MTSSNDITQLLDRLFAGEEARPREIAAAAAVISADDDACAYYDGLAHVDAALGGDFEARLGEAWFLAGLDEVLAEEAATPANTNRPVGMWISAAALVLCALAGVLGAPEAGPEFQARSGVTPATSSYRASELAVFCVRREGSEVRFQSARDFEFGTVRCPLDAEIKLAARTADPRLRWGAFFGIAPTGTMTWYGPSPAAPAPLAVPRADAVQPIGETIRLQVNHQPGPTRVIGIFSQEPLEWSDVEQIVRTNATRLRDGAIDIEGAAIVRQTLEVTAP